MIWICISAGHDGISRLVKIYSFKNWPLEKLWGWGQGIFELHEISLYEFFWGYFEPPPPPTPPNQFSKVPSLNYEYAQNFHLGNLCKWWAPLIHQCKLCNTCQAFEREMTRNFLTTNKLCNNYRLQRDSRIAFYLHTRSSDHTVGSLLTDTSDADGHLYTDEHLCIPAT